MKTKTLVMSFLVFILGSSVNENDSYKKEILVSGKIITQGRWMPNGNLEFYVRHHNGKIQSLNLRGSTLFISRTKVIEIKNLNKEALTPISLHESLDAIFSLDISSSFNENGGNIYASITNNNLHTDYYRIDILKNENTFKTYCQKLYDPIDSSIEEFYEINIYLDQNRNIKNHKIVFK
jgi:hypothetical protein